jgi:hypothetical protein
MHYTKIIINLLTISVFVCRDYISPTTLRIEFGIANEMNQLENNAKLQKILGTNDGGEADHRSMFSSLVKPIFSSSASAALRKKRRSALRSETSSINSIPADSAKSPQSSGTGECKTLSVGNEPSTSNSESSKQSAIAKLGPID